MSFIDYPKVYLQRVDICCKWFIDLLGDINLTGELLLLRFYGSLISELEH